MVTKELIYEALTEVLDPEISIDIVNLGLIYDATISEDGKDIVMLMTFTTAGCPSGDYIANSVYEVVKKLDGVENVRVEVTFNPPWEPTMMSEEAKLVLSLYR